MKIGCALAGEHLPSIAKATFAHSGLREELLLKVMDLVNEEVDTLCRKEKQSKSPSLFRHIPVLDMESFTLKDCIQQLQEKSPFLYQLIISLVQRNDHCNESKRGDSHIPGIRTAVAILLKERNQHVWYSNVSFTCVVYFSSPQKGELYVIIDIPFQ